MKIKNKVSIELLDWMTEDLKNHELNINFKKCKKIMDIAIKHGKKHKRLFGPSNFYKYSEKENRLYYYYDYHCECGILKENYEVILK